MNDVSGGTEIQILPINISKNIARMVLKFGLATGLEVLSTVVVKYLIFEKGDLNWNQERAQLLQCEARYGG